MPAIQESDYFDVESRAAALGMTNFADVTVLPNYLGTLSDPQELDHDYYTPEIVQALRDRGINASALNTPDERVRVLRKKSGTLLGPILFFAASYLIQNPNAVNVALGVIANYLTDWFKVMGLPPDRPVRLEIVTKKTKTTSYTSISYEGSIAGLEKLGEATHRLLLKES